MQTPVCCRRRWRSHNSASPLTLSAPPSRTTWPTTSPPCMYVRVSAPRLGADARHRRRAAGHGRRAHSTARCRRCGGRRSKAPPPQRCSGSATARSRHRHTRRWCVPRPWRARHRPPVGPTACACALSARRRWWLCVCVCVCVGHWGGHRAFAGGRMPGAARVDPPGRAQRRRGAHGALEPAHDRFAGDPANGPRSGAPRELPRRVPPDCAVPSARWRTPPPVHRARPLTWVVGWARTQGRRTAAAPASKAMQR